NGTLRTRRVPLPQTVAVIGPHEEAVVLFVLHFFVVAFVHASRWEHVVVPDHDDASDVWACSQRRSYFRHVGSMRGRWSVHVADGGGAFEFGKQVVGIAGTDLAPEAVNVRDDEKLLEVV